MVQNSPYNVYFGQEPGPPTEDQWRQSATNTFQAPGATTGFSVNGRSRFGIQPMGTDQVWLGKMKTGPVGVGQAYGTGTGFGQQYETMSIEEAARLPITWDEKTLREFVNKGIINKIPGFDANMGMPEISSAWHDMLSYAWANSTDEKQISPWDVMDSYANNEGKFGTKKSGDWIIDVATGERLKYVGPTSKTTTSKRIDLSSAADVKALTYQMLRETLGRAPNDKELAQFRSTINNLEQASPEMVTTTTQLKPVEGGQFGMELEETGSETLVTGGISAEAKALAAQEEVRRTPEYGKYQSATTYFPALMAMITGG